MNEVEARVIIQEKGMYTLCHEGKEKLAAVSGKLRYEAEDETDYPAVGDYVLALWPEDESPAVITSVFPRKSVFVRKAAGTDCRKQVVAANIDTVFICMSLNRDFNLRRLERYLAAAWDSGAEPVVLLTKADLCGEIEQRMEEVKAAAAGVKVASVSSLREDYEAVRAYMDPGKTVAFIGSSGVGKSTLINRLLGDEVIRTTGIREDDDKGRHTTTHRELITLANGACVIDTPGMRELGMLGHEEGVETVFMDVEAFAAGCRFRDCTHTNEPGCGVRAALKDGRLSKERWNAYRKLAAENLYNHDEYEYMKSKKAKFKEIAKINRRKR